MTFYQPSTASPASPPMVRLRPSLLGSPVAAETFSGSNTL